MSLRDSQFGDLKVPLTWTAAVALIVAAVVAVTLLLTDRRETFRPEAYGQTRSAADKVLAPVGQALSAPIRWTGAGVDAVRGYFFAISENRRLKGELKEMRQWRDVALALKNENGRFRSLLGLKTDPPIAMVGARIVIDSRGPFADTRIANAGREAGVAPGNPVMSEYGLVGRVIGVTAGASRVLMLTDAASRTPVMIERTNARAILAGDGGPNPRLDYLRGQDPVREGDRILTSGDGGMMPRGLPVGFAVKGLDAKWRVVLASDKGPIDFVRVLLFQDFTQLVDRKALDQLPVPPPTPGMPPDQGMASQAQAAQAEATQAAAATGGPPKAALAPKPAADKPVADKAKPPPAADVAPAAKSMAAKPKAAASEPGATAAKPPAKKAAAAKPATAKVPALDKAAPAKTPAAAKTAKPAQAKPAPAKPLPPKPAHKAAPAHAAAPEEPPT